MAPFKAIIFLAAAAVSRAAVAPSGAALARTVIEQTPPLRFPRGHRLPLVVWALQDVAAQSDAETVQILRDLDARGFAAMASWNSHEPERSLAAALRLGRLQQQLGLKVVANATDALRSFFNGDPATAHVDDRGRPFFDRGIPKTELGCPFALQGRIPVVKAQVAYFVAGYRQAGLPLDLVIADWEKDGPIEWGDAQAAARRCVRCREHIPHPDDFAEVQAAYRTVRSALQRECFADVVRQAYPRALVGNYGVYPDQGYREWYDYYEPATFPGKFRADYGAKYRAWFPEFAPTGYNLALPVSYTWYPTYQWYPFADSDYRWFYNLLRVATTAVESAGRSVPVVNWVHWHTTVPPAHPDPAVRQMSERAYTELLWHFYLRGEAGTMLWCTNAELGQEARLEQAVYAAALEYRDFLERGEPVAFDVPAPPGAVVSALRLGDRLLVRRTNFGGDPSPIALMVAGHRVMVPSAPGRCQLIALPR